MPVQAHVLLQSAAILSALVGLCDAMAALNGPLSPPFCVSMHQQVRQEPESFKLSQRWVLLKQH
jgi:hypothetical protein